MWNCNNCFGCSLGDRNTASFVPVALILYIAFDVGKILKGIVIAAIVIAALQYIFRWIRKK